MSIVSVDWTNVDACVPSIGRMSSSTSSPTPPASVSGLTQRGAALGAAPRRGLADPWRKLVALSPATLLVATVTLFAADWTYERAGDSFFPGGALDETAHLLTMLLVLWALGPRFCRPRVLLPALVASVAIDIDHIPGYLGADWLTAGTPRPYTHSLLMLAAFVAAAVIWRRRRVALFAIALGLTVHFWRDLSESGAGVSLLWPWSDHVFTLPHTGYLLAIGAIVGVDAMRCRQRGAVIEAGASG